MSTDSFHRRVGIITAMPSDPRVGSGCAVATQNLAAGLGALGAKVEMIRPEFRIPVFTFQRLLFNQRLRGCDFSRFDVTVGIDADGYAQPGSHPPHVANIKGVLGDTTRFESGWTRMSMELQARLEAKHVHRADKVITISQYCAGRIRRCYGFESPIAIVPEAIDLETWRALFRKYGSEPDPTRFTVLCVCHLYPRKRVDVLLRSAAAVRRQAPELRVRIVGDGPEGNRLRRIWRRLGLEDVVEWLGPVRRHRLTRELSAAHAFCLPSVQEGFGIAFLEAMAAGLPIVAVRAAAVPEVVPHALLTAPDDVQSLAEALLALYESKDLRSRIAEAGKQQVQRYSLPAVSEQFARECEDVCRG